LTSPVWIDAAITAARAEAIGALLRYFRDLDTAEEAFQEASLRALRTWPVIGPPRDPAAWLILVGRNCGLADQTGASSNGDLADRLDGSHFRDDILRLLFMCCHPDLPATQQIALALRVVSGLSVRDIARAFLVTDAAMQKRIVRAKASVAKAQVPFEATDPTEREQRLESVAEAIYLLFCVGYSAASQPGSTRARLCEEAIRLARMLLRLFKGEPEIMGLVALLLLQHAQARTEADDPSPWLRMMMTEGLALVDKAVRHGQPGAYQIQAAIAALHLRAADARDIDWAQLDRLYTELEHLQPSPVVTLNRAIAVAKTRGPAAALELIEPLAATLAGYFYYHGVKGSLLRHLGQEEAARRAFDQAISLANSVAEAAHIRQHLDRLMEDSAPRQSAALSDSPAPP
jgi:RNA polymerase sigma-70 factor, ECF subfamily